jgi:hypothetical protein
MQHSTQKYTHAHKGEKEFLYVFTGVPIGVPFLSAAATKYMN